MADSSLCKIDGCDNPVKARGWCHAHYCRWSRYGDPLAGGPPRGEKYGAALAYFKDIVLNHRADECLFWPFSRSDRGYAHLGVPGGTKNVHRLVCEERHGPPPERSEAAHSCGKGHLGCVAWQHLSWKTRSANQMDRVEHGTSNRGERQHGAKLTEPEVRAIKERLLAGESPATLAREFGVSRTTVSGIKRGDSWNHLR